MLDRNPTAICQLFVICFPAVDSYLLASFMSAVCKIFFTVCQQELAICHCLLLFTTAAFKKVQKSPLEGLFLSAAILFGSKQNVSKDNLILHKKIELAHPTQIILLLSYLNPQQQRRKKIRRNNFAGNLKSSITS